jgi:hypothetical protein
MNTKGMEPEIHTFIDYSGSDGKETLITNPGNIELRWLEASRRKWFLKSYRIRTFTGGAY